MCDVDVSLEGTVAIVDSPPKEKKEDPEVVSRRQYKEAMRQFFTVRRQTVVGCGHKYNDSAQPRNNCDMCWFAFFKEHGEVVNLAHEIYRDKGKGALVCIRGEKFTKNFERFMSTLMKWKREEEAKNGEGSSEGSTNDEGKQVRQPESVGEAA